MNFAIYSTGPFFKISLIGIVCINTSETENKIKFKYLV